MNQPLTARNKGMNKKAALSMLLLVILFIALTMVQDLIEANFQKSAFYFSESFMFSSFWWLFAPLLFAQYYFIERQKIKRLFSKILIMVLPALLHLFTYPGLVWLISKLFYHHTFRYQQTLQYGLAEYLYSLLFFYTVPVVIYLRFRRKHEALPAVIPDALPVIPGSILVQDGTRRISVAVAGILYFTANPPYVNIHVHQRKYLYNETLKSVLEKLAHPAFVRIHKSAIVNIKQVVSYTSRQNGDYDVTMKDGNILRVSRNYAATFKAALLQSHQLAAK